MQTSLPQQLTPLSIAANRGGGALGANPPQNCS